MARARKRRAQSPQVELLFPEVRQRIVRDCLRRKLRPRDADAYADAVVTYLALAVSGMADTVSSLATWESTGEKVRGLFGRQAIPMVWDFAEVNPFDAFEKRIESVALVLERLPAPDPLDSCEAQIRKLDELFWQWYREDQAA